MALKISGIHITLVTLNSANDNPSTIDETGVLQAGLLAPGLATDWLIGNAGSISGMLGGLPELSIAARNAVQTEGNAGTKAFTFIVELRSHSSSDVFTRLSVTGRGANPANAQDFAGGVLPSDLVRFRGGGHQSQTTTVNITGDTVIERDEGFHVTLSANPYSVGIRTATATGTITDDDTTVLSIAALNAVQTEGNAGTKAFTFTVTRRGVTTGATAAAWALTGRGANQANAQDFADLVLPSGTVSFAAGETSQTITIDVSGDTLGERDEGFDVTLYPRMGGSGQLRGEYSGRTVPHGHIAAQRDHLGRVHPGEWWPVHHRASAVADIGVDLYLQLP